MNILHLCHGVYGRNNGLDTYLRNFIFNSPDNNIVIVPKGKNKDSQDLNIIEIEDLKELVNLVHDLKIDIMIIHWTGQESLKENDDFLTYQGKLISKTGKGCESLFTRNFSPNDFVNTALLWTEQSKKHKIIIISHACYRLPSYLTFGTIDAIVHVSYEAFKVNKRIKNNHFVIYPALGKEFFKQKETVPADVPHQLPKKITFGWLGRLNKIDPEVYSFLKNKFAGNNLVKFIFAGEDGNPDEEVPNNFSFPGNMVPEEFFKQIDIFIYPTSIDSFSLSLLEALSQDKLCICSAVVRELAEIGGAIVYKNIAELENILDEIIKSGTIVPVYGQSDKILKSFSHETLTKNFQQLFKYIS